MKLIPAIQFKNIQISRGTEVITRKINLERAIEAKGV